MTDSTSADTLHVSNHPAVLHKLGVLRDERTEPKKFREVVRELSWLLGYEALQDAKTSPLTIRAMRWPSWATSRRWAPGAWARRRGSCAQRSNEPLTTSPRAAPPCTAGTSRRTAGRAPDIDTSCIDR